MLPVPGDFFCPLTYLGANAMATPGDPIYQDLSGAFGLPQKPIVGKEERMGADHLPAGPTN